MHRLRSGVAFARGCIGLRPIQSPNSVPPSVRYRAVQPQGPSGALSIEARLEAIERRIDQLEKRVDAALPPSAPGAAAGSASPGSVPMAAALVASPGESAAAGSAGPASVGDRLDELDQKLSLLQHVGQVKEGAVTVGRDTFSLVSPDKAFRLRFGGHFQADGKTFYDDDTHLLDDNFTVRRARPILEGELGRYIDFRLMPDFGNGQALLYDAYADVKLQPYAVIRGGKFKTPLGLELLQNDADRTFIENALPSDLVPNRDEGFQVYGDVLGRFTYTVAAINGAPDGTNIDGDTHNGKDVVGRIFATPFASSGPEALRGLGFGAAASSGRQDEGALLPTFKSTGGLSTFFSYTSTAAAAGRRLNYSPQLYYYAGPFGLMSEYVVSGQEISNQAAKSSLLTRDLSNHSWQVAGSWVLTGEPKSYKSLVPRANLEDGKNHIGRGAWELAARYADLTVDPAAFTLKFADPTKSAKGAQAWTVGLNWYLNYFVKFQFDYEQTRFQGGATAGDRPTEKVLEERLQIAF